MARLNFPVESYKLTHRPLEKMLKQFFPGGIDGNSMLELRGGGKALQLIHIVADTLPGPISLSDNAVILCVDGWQFNSVLDTVRNESPVSVDGQSSGANIVIYTGDEPVGEGE